MRQNIHNAFFFIKNILEVFIIPYVYPLYIYAIYNIVNGIQVFIHVFIREEICLGRSKILKKKQNKFVMRNKGSKEGDIM